MIDGSVLRNTKSELLETRYRISVNQKIDVYKTLYLIINVLVILIDEKIFGSKATE